MSGLYDTDFVLWSEQQAGLLRRLARGEKVNDVDWENLVEEVDSLGRAELSTVQSLWQRALEHLLKTVAWPGSDACAGWMDEAGAFLDKAGYHWAPSMAQRIDLDSIYRRALRRVDALAYREGPPAPLPATCPVTMADLLDPDPGQLARRFTPPT